MPMPNDLADLDAIAARDMMARGDLAAVSYVGALLERIADPGLPPVVTTMPGALIVRASAHIAAD